jgi:hypothetical protein
MNPLSRNFFWKGRLTNILVRPPFTQMHFDSSDVCPSFVYRQTELKSFSRGIAAVKSPTSYQHLLNTQQKHLNLRTFDFPAIQKKSLESTEKTTIGLTAFSFGRSKLVDHIEKLA